MRPPSVKVLLGTAGAVLVLGGCALLAVCRRERWQDASLPPPPIAEALRLYASDHRAEADAAVGRFLHEFRSPSWELRARVLAASRSVSAGDDGAVLRFLPRPPAAEDPLAPITDLLRARGLAAAKRWSEAEAAAARAAGAGGFPGREEAVRLRALALESSGSAPRAIALLGADPSPALRLEAARIARRAGDPEAARKQIAALVLDGPPGDDAERALDLLLDWCRDPERRFVAGESARITVAARRWAEAGRVSGAIALLRASRRAGTGPASLPPDSALLEAELLLRQGKAAEAEPLVRRAASGSRETAEGAAYLAARIRLARGDGNAYRVALRRLSGATLPSRWRAQALLEIARAADGAPSQVGWEAYRRYRLAAGRDADVTALWREAWIAFELGRRRDAEEGIARVLSHADAPGSVRAAALYWSGRCLEDRGRRGEAMERYREIRARFRNHHYGILAARRLGIPPSPAVKDGPVPRAECPPAAARWLEAARLLGSVGLSQDAAAAYRAAASAAPSAARGILLEAADDALAGDSGGDALEFLDLAVKDRDAAELETIPRRLLRLLVPAPQGPLVARSARATRLDPHLVAAVVLQESAFNPLAVSAAGARGLMQLMPGTGAEMARQIGLRGFGPERLFDPELNLKLGCAYLRKMLDGSRSLPLALASFNAGPARASRWALPSDGADGERFVERIPIAETRSYVKRVLANQRLYRLVYPSGLDSDTP